MTRRAAQVTLRYPPWMQPGESNEVAQFTILGASPHGQEDGVVDMLTMLTTTPPVHRTHAPSNPVTTNRQRLNADGTGRAGMRDLYEFHRGIRDEIKKQAHIVKPRMRWLVAGRPALGFVTAFTDWGKTLVRTSTHPHSRGDDDTLSRKSNTHLLLLCYAVCRVCTRC